MLIQIIAFARIILNHFVNIPLNFIIGSGKTAAFVIAFGIDIAQIAGYYYLLEKKNAATKLKNLFTKNLPDEKKVKLSPFAASMKRFGYVGILFLAAMPIYFGGVWTAVVTSHALSLNRRKSCVFLITGSLIGCVLWVLGIFFILEKLRALFLLLVSRL